MALLMFGFDRRKTMCVCVESIAVRAQIVGNSTGKRILESPEKSILVSRIA